MYPKTAQKSFIVDSFYRLIAPLKIRGFRLFWGGQVISGLGDATQTVALSWLLLDLTNSPLALSGALLAIILPRILFVFSGGVSTDGWDARTVILYADASRAGIIGLIVLLAFLHELPLFLLYGLLVPYGAARRFFFH